MNRPPTRLGRIEASTSPDYTNGAASAFGSQENVSLPIRFRLRTVLLVVGLCALLLAGGRYGLLAIRENASRQLCENQLKCIWLSLSAYEQTHSALPSATIRDATGSPILSWRAVIRDYVLYDAVARVDMTADWRSLQNSAPCG